MQIPRWLPGISFFMYWKRTLVSPRVQFQLNECLNVFHGVVGTENHQGQRALDIWDKDILKKGKWLITNALWCNFPETVRKQEFWKFILPSLGPKAVEHYPQMHWLVLQLLLFKEAGRNTCPGVGKLGSAHAYSILPYLKKYIFL